MKILPLRNTLKNYEQDENTWEKFLKLKDIGDSIFDQYSNGVFVCENANEEKEVQIFVNELLHWCDITSNPNVEEVEEWDNKFHALMDPIYSRTNEEEVKEEVKEDNVNVEVIINVKQPEPEPEEKEFLDGIEDKKR